MAHVLGPKLEDELDDIWLYIAAESSSLDIANRFVDLITEQFSLLSRHPYLGRKRDDLAAGLRSLAVGSYVIIYRVEGSDVRILHVVHGRRDLKDVIRR
jgi:toxin ParE1/3/4